MAADPFSSHHKIRTPWLIAVPNALHRTKVWAEPLQEWMNFSNDGRFGFRFYPRNDVIPGSELSRLWGFKLGGLRGRLRWIPSQEDRHSALLTPVRFRTGPAGAPP